MIRWIAKRHANFNCLHIVCGRLEVDRTLEPHGCEPCALPSVTVITDKKQGSICQKTKETGKKGSKQGV